MFLEIEADLLDVKEGKDIILIVKTVETRPIDTILNILNLVCILEISYTVKYNNITRFLLLTRLYYQLEKK